MSADVEVTLRGPEAYGLARLAVDQMEKAGVWPTPLNFELWLHYVGDPEGLLGQEIERLLAAGHPITEEVSEHLAASFLPRARLTDEIRDAGALLTRELSSVAEAMTTAQRSQAAYGRTLADAGEGLLTAQEAPEVRKLVERLASATRKVQHVNSSLERRLQQSSREVNRLREHLEQVRRDAMTDALTNLANRKAFDEQITRLCSEADESGGPLSLAVVDIDHFKRFNDTWGHQTGDQVLRYVASVLARIASPPRFAARFGGEEFALLFPGESAGAVGRLMDEVRGEIASRSLKRRSTNEDLGIVTISAGAAERYNGESAAAFLERADEALYASKRNGRNRITLASGDSAIAAA